MGVFIDLLALIVIIVCAGIAYYKGFVKTFFGFISTIIAIILACIFCESVAIQIKESTQIDEWIENSIMSIEFETSDEEGIDELDEIDEIESGDEMGLLDFIDALPSSVKENLDFEETKEELKKSVALKVSNIVINIFSWIIIYAVIRIILMIVTIVFHGIMSLPFLKTINNMAGLVLGGIMGIFRIYLILAIVYFVSNIIDITGLVSAIQTSVVVSHMYNSNLLISLIF